jgi:hypothetical protein
VHNQAVDYDLSRLGDRLFEHLTQALVVAALGPGVEVFGDGPDGGREASFDGKVDLRTGPAWDGYGVVQAKYKRRADGTAADQAWLLAELRDELGRWLAADSRRRRRPRYLLIVTNVRLTGVAGSGGIDRVGDLMAEFHAKGLELDGFQVWHGDKVRALLETYSEIRRAYADLVLPGDVIARLHEQLRESDRKIEHAWLSHAGRALLAGGTVALGEAGDAANKPLALEAVAVDIEARFVAADGTARGALATLLQRADQVLAPLVGPADKARIVVLGGPGQGKSTIGRILCQIYRIAMLSSREPQISSEVRESAQRMRAAYTEAGIPAPVLHRIPLYASLPSYADEIGGGADVSLLRHLTAKVNHRAGERLDDSEMRKLLRSWPSLIVLDGLDEVAAPSVRADLVERITDFLGDMAAAGADVLLVATSRPQGFEDALPIAHYDHLILQRLGPRAALRYADRLLAQRHAHDADKRDMVAGRLRDAMTEPNTARLMETPLQVTIMTVLLESVSRPPRSRHGLFDRYYEVIYAREVNKPGPVGELLARYRETIDALHARTAFVLHRDAETAGEADSILAPADFRALALAMLDEDKWPADVAGPLADDLLLAATHRLVLIVPRRHGVGFEVRSLQEFMAAKALTDGSDQDIPARLEALAPSAHWRNTWLLAAGRVFATRRTLRAAIINLIDRIDESNVCRMLVMPGACLAVDILDDGLAVDMPGLETDLLTSAMRLLDGPACRHLVPLAFVLRSRFPASSLVRETATTQVVKRTSDTAAPAGALTLLTRLANGHDDLAAWAGEHRREFLERFAGAPELVAYCEAALEPDGVILPPLEVGVMRSKWHQEDPLGVITRSVPTPGADTGEVLRLRETAAVYARGLGLTNWRTVTVIREALHEAVTRDVAGAALTGDGPAGDVPRR